jgi:regulatory protein
VAAALGLRVGQAITPERLQEIARAETLRRAREDAYRLLGFRARSENEIRDRLARKGYEDEVIAQVLDGLRADGYVDDRAFTEDWGQGARRHARAARPRPRAAPEGGSPPKWSARRCRAPGRRPTSLPPRAARR